LIAAAGKKSYTFVVGKVNAAKIANFSEVGGWVVVGCWESSLFESRDFWKPVVTPWELELCLKGDDERVWSGAWSSDFQDVLRMEKEREGDTGAAVIVEGVTTTKEEQSNETELEDSEEESEPPEFDLRTGKYVSHSRPMGRSQPTTSSSPALGNTPQTSTALLKRANGDLATINGVVSPAAEYFKNKRTWQGLGSDYEIKYDEEDQGAKVEPGRKGIARGYVVGEDEVKR
jgi:diphthamide biosynthesis protein 2